MLFFNDRNRNTKKDKKVCSHMLSELHKASRTIIAQINLNTRELLEQFSAKIGKDNKKLSLQLDDLYSLVGEKTDDKIAELENKNTAAVKSMMSISDMIEDFYAYAKKQDDQDILAQAGLMWANSCKMLGSAGLARISDDNAVFDPLLNQVHRTVNDNSRANGVITEVLRSGYIYNGSVVRKSAVVVNKTGGNA